MDIQLVTCVRSSFYVFQFCHEHIYWGCDWLGHRSQFCCHDPATFCSDSSFPFVMPFSMLGQSSKMAAAAIARPCSTTHMGANVGAHGLRSRPRVPKRVSVPPAPQHRSAHTSSTRLSCKTSLLKSHEKTPTKSLGRRARSTIAELFRGNEEYMAAMSKDNPGLLASLAKDGQRAHAFPSYMRAADVPQAPRSCSSTARIAGACAPDVPPAELN